jgi:cyanophycinase
VETSVIAPEHTLDLRSFPVLDGVGTLVIVGGGGTPAMVHDLFFHLAGGPPARVVHLPSATRTFEEIPDKREYYREFYTRKLSSFEFLHTYDRAVAERPEFARPLREATGVWIGGGTQSRLADLFLGTAVLAAIHDLLARGGVVGGTSSGCAIMSETMICYGYEELAMGQGFALYPKAICDSHFTQRKRFKRVPRAARLRPDHVAIGIDERTALVVRGNQLRLIGPHEGAAWFHFADPASGAVYRYRLGIGETLDLPVPVRGASVEVLRECLHAAGEPHAITAEELAPPDE